MSTRQLAQVLEFVREHLNSARWRDDDGTVVELELVEEFIEQLIDDEEMWEVKE